jgi:DNA-binding protein HU-beta
MYSKKDMIDKLAADNKFTKADSRLMIEAVIDMIADVILEEGECRLPNLGTFTVKETVARQGKNPQTGEPMLIPASRTIRFSAAAPLRRAVKEK